MVRVKVCGITNEADALAAVEAGADALGFNFVAGTPRCLEPEKARAIIRVLPPFVVAVGVFVDAPLERMRALGRVCSLSALQLHGEEAPGLCRGLASEGWRIIKAVKMRGPESLEEMRRYGGCAFLLDAYRPDRAGGTGSTFDWELAARAQEQVPIILAGGLTPDNVEEAVRRVKPYALDVCSGVEAEPGRKDMGLLRDFIQRARAASL
ncbi:MAG: phosphoribosylanthranilate isomerase [Nitrospinota bacterium]